MAAQRKLIPIAAFLAIIIALVGVRLWASNDADTGPVAESPGDSSSSASPAAALTDGVRFTDVTGTSGLDAPHSDTDLTGESAMTAGAAVADVDDDGDLDIYLTRVGLPNRLLMNDGTGAFTDEAAQAGVVGVPDQGSSAAAFTDVDGDGDSDLVVTGAGRDGTTLYLNDGGGVFTDATAGSGLDDTEQLPVGELAQAHGITVADYDRDGRMDLLVTHWDDVIPAALSDAEPGEIRPDADGRTVCARSEWLRARGFPRAEGATANRGRLYHNEGEGRFRDVAAEVGLPFDEILAFTASFSDVDGDGWDDLLITGDFCMSRLFRNIDGVRFSDVTDASGVGTDENGMGSVVHDVDGDGSPDWFITSIGPVGDEAEPLPLGGFGSSGNRMYLNDGTGTFTDATDQLGLRNGGWGWGAAIEDFANDSTLAVVMTNGYSTGEEGEGADTPAGDPLIYWVRDGGGFVDAAGDVGLEDTGLGRALIPFDMDRDGDLDLLVANFAAPPVLYRNDTPSRHWLTVQLDDPATPGNRDGVGAKVVVTPTGGDAVTQWVSTSGSYESQRPPEVHVGLASIDEVERIEVTWPDGGEPQVLEDVEADQVLVVTRTPADSQ